MVDVDGTIIDRAGRPNEKVLKLIGEYQETYKLPIVILTARHEIMRKETENFVISCGLTFQEIIMCRDEDLAGLSPDNMQTSFKIKAIKMSSYNPVVLFDDNPLVLSAFKKEFSSITINAMTLEVE